MREYIILNNLISTATSTCFAPGAMASSSAIISNCAWNGFASPSSYAFTNTKAREPTSFLAFSPRFMPETACNSSRLRICIRRVGSKRAPVLSCVGGEGSGAIPKPGDSSYPSDSQEKASIDLKLPRRSLLVKFTCNACSVRSEKLVSRLAYERGTVFVQCSGCFQYHRLVDNLGLIVEYDFREELDADPNANTQ